MRVAAVERPRSVEEAVVRLADLGGRARVLAGGTALVPWLRSSPTRRGLTLVSLDAVTGLDVVRTDERDTEIGASTRLATLERDGVVGRRLPTLTRCLATVANPRIRGMATLGGHLAQADAGYDIPVLLAALGARVRVRGPGGEREALVEDLARGHEEPRALGVGEIITAVVIPHDASLLSWFLKFSPRTGTDRAVINVAIALRLDGEDRCERARVVLGGMGPRLVLARETEERLHGCRLAAAAQAVQTVAAGTRPPDDVRASAAYRRAVAPAITLRAVEAAWRLGQPRQSIDEGK